MRRTCLLGRPYRLSIHFSNVQITELFRPIVCVCVLTLLRKHTVTISGYEGPYCVVWVELGGWGMTPTQRQKCNVKLL